MRSATALVSLVLVCAAACEGRNAAPASIADTAEDASGREPTADADPTADASSACLPEEVVAVLAGPDALDCGLAPLFQSPAAVYACFVTAVQHGKPAHALFRNPGIDSQIVRGLVRRPSGALWVVFHDSNPMGGRAWQPKATAARCIGPSFAAPGGVLAPHCQALAHSDANLCGRSAPVLDVAAVTDAEVPWTPDALQLQAVETGHGVWGPYPPLPLPWTSLVIENGPCPPSTSCKETWMVSRSGKVQAFLPGRMPSSRELSEPEVRTLHDLVGPAGFLLSGQDCPFPPTDNGTRFRLIGDPIPDSGVPFDVTGCVYESPDSLPAKVYALVTGGPICAGQPLQGCPCSKTDAPCCLWVSYGLSCSGFGPAQSLKWAPFQDCGCDPSPKCEGYPVHGLCPAD